MVQMAASRQDLGTWDNFQWRRRMETFGQRDEPVVALGPGGDMEGIWQVGSTISDENKRPFVD